MEVARQAGPEWDQLLAEVKRRKPAIAGVLLQAASEIIDGKIQLTYDEGSFYVARARDLDFQTYVESLAQELFSRSFRLEICTRGRVAGTESISTATQDRAREREALQNPVVQKALSMFGAKVEEIKPLK